MDELRDAVSSDLPRLVEVFLDCWRLSYAATLPAELVGMMTEERASDVLARSLASEASTFVVAVEGVEEPDIRGFTVYRIEPDGTGYVASLYVSPHAQGGGFGGRLLAEAESRMARLGATTARLWVFRDNAPSIAFYERRGWSLDGRVETLDEWGQPQVGMSKRLTDG